MIVKIRPPPLYHARHKFRKLISVKPSIVNSFARGPQYLSIRHALSKQVGLISAREKVKSDKQVSSQRQINLVCLGGQIQIQVALISSS
ncbi:hypothetical protein FGO68_gene4211 [Halteria grandinella]|uniref:Uncharacterized protein n=1 Tax=Halteria grandinella TaxID=5974 RepID=A0A8J8NG58_HALGN|nr:hypothetical protein FGO68_gene4211 [Halteria grandinella]